MWLGLKSLSKEFVSLRGLKCREQRWGGVGVSFLCLREACCGGAMPHIKDKSGVNGFLVVLRKLNQETGRIVTDLSRCSSVG